MTKIIVKIAALAAAALATAGAASAQNSPYRHQHLVQAIVDNRIDTEFDHTDQTSRAIRASYLAGFSYYYDSRCDFLPVPTFEAIKTIIGRINQEVVPGSGEAAQIGLVDAKAFLAEQGCATREAQAARGALTTFWQATVRQIQSGGQQAPGPRGPASVRGGTQADWGSERNRM